MSCSTASSLSIIFAGLTRGCSRKDFSIRLPMEVLVWSSTHRSEPFFSLFLRVSVSSRFLLAVKPIVMIGSASCFIISENLPTSAFCVSCMYAKSPHTAKAATVSGFTPIDSRLFVENCFSTSSVCISGEKSFSSKS